MQRRIIVGAGILVLTALSLLLWIQHAPQTVESLRFSNTQVWDESLTPYLTENLSATARRETERYLAAISLPPPPADASTETASELATLHEYARTVRASAQADIEAEVYASNLRWGHFVYGDNDKTLTTELLLAAREQLLSIVMTLKRDFDRVRPTHLDPTLTAAIDIPGHPAYPSGHAAEAYTNALILSELNPAQREVYIADAARIAQNREIAGVHYPSDSEAGKRLAEQFVPLFLATANGQELLSIARSEWE